MLTGFAVLLLANIAATQYAAYRFGYQPALGNPVYRTGHATFYQPFAWTMWVLRYSGSDNIRVRGPVQIAELIAMAGCGLAIAVFYLLNLRRTKALSRNAEDLHGSARWANAEDVKATGLLDSKQGVYVGGWLHEATNHLHYLRHNGPEHILAFAPTRSGKGVGLVIPTLLAWSESAVVYDIKGENWAKTAGFRRKQGHLCFKFSPVEVGASSRFNPLAEIRLFTRARSVSEATLFSAAAA
jgi:type IV secretion system protein VirD4